MFGRFTVLFYLGDGYRAVVREGVDDRIDAAHDAQNRFERFVGEGERVGVIVGECRDFYEREEAASISPNDCRSKTKWPVAQVQSTIAAYSAWVAGRSRPWPAARFPVAVGATEPSTER